MLRPVVLGLVSCALIFTAMNGYAASGTPSKSDEETKVAESDDVVRRPPAVIFSQRMKTLNVKKAYSLQKAYVKNSVAKGIEISGFKAGLMREGAAAKFGLSAPVTGVLIEMPLQGNKFTVNSRQAYQMLLEQEIAYKIAENISTPVTEESVSQYIEAVAPAFELPDFSFNDQNFNGLDIIANNVIAYKLVVGDWKAYTQMGDKLDNINVNLVCDGKSVGSGTGKDLMGGQKKALTWMINNLIEQGYTVQKGQTLITGNLLKMSLAKPCNYVADYGDLGKIELTIL